MSEIYQNHELNGYKFSFSRVNPYIQQSPQKVQDRKQKVNVKQILTSKKKIQPLNKKKTIEAPQTEVIRKDQEKMRVNLIKNSNHFKKQSKNALYNQVQQNQKNKILLDLYLRKAKFHKMKTKGSKIDKTQIRPKVQQFQKVTPKIHSFSEFGQKLHDLKIGLQSPQNVKKQNLQLIATIRKKCKSVKDFHHKSLLPYSVSKLNLGIRRKNETHDIIIQKQKDETNETNNKLSTSSRKLKKINHLRINTQFTTTPPDNINILDEKSSIYSIISARNARNSENIRENIGAASYKTPKVCFTSRNQFQNRKMLKKQGMKIKLFTDQQEKQIIKEFYISESKQKQKDSTQHILIK